MPTGEIVVSERIGRMRILSPNGQSFTHITNVPVVVNLFDVVVDPASSPELTRLFIAYTAATSNGTRLQVSRVTLIGNKLKDFEEVLHSDSTKGVMLLSGGRLATDGKSLWVSVGDNEPSQAQDRHSTAGKVLRADLHNGAVRIYSSGHRNIQALHFDQPTSTLWSAEHGPVGGDELNVLQFRKNYGWPVVSSGEHNVRNASSAPTKIRYVDPTTVWTPAIAPSGLTLYRGRVFTAWFSNIFIGSLTQKHVRRLELSDQGSVLHEEVLSLGTDERIRDVRTGPDGLLYVLTDSMRGQLLRIEPAVASSCKTRTNDTLDIYGRLPTVK